MTLSVYEFGQFDIGSGFPLHPPDKVTLGVALPASVTLATTTRLVQLVPGADVRVTTDGSTPGQTDYFVANKGLATLRVIHPRSMTIKAVAST